MTGSGGGDDRCEPAVQGSYPIDCEAQHEDPEIAVGKREPAPRCEECPRGVDLRRIRHRAEIGLQTVITLPDRARHLPRWPASTPR